MRQALPPRLPLQVVPILRQEHLPALPVTLVMSRGANVHMHGCAHLHACDGFNGMCTVPACLCDGLARGGVRLAACFGRLFGDELGLPGRHACWRVYNTGCICVHEMLS